MKLEKRIVSYTDAVSAVGKSLKLDELLEVLIRTEDNLQEKIQECEKLQSTNEFFLQQLIERESNIEHINRQIDQFQSIIKTLEYENTILNENLRKLQPKVVLNRDFNAGITPKREPPSCADKQLQAGISWITDLKSSFMPRIVSVSNIHDIVSNVSSSSVVKFTCSVCRLSFNEFKFLKTHMLQMHSLKMHKKAASNEPESTTHPTLKVRQNEIVKA